MEAAIEELVDEADELVDEAEVDEERREAAEEDEFRPAESAEPGPPAATAADHLTTGPGEGLRQAGVERRPAPEARAPPLARRPHRVPG